MGPTSYALTALLNLTARSVDYCGVKDIEVFVSHDLNACPEGNFDKSCNSSYSSSLEYLPVQIQNDREGRRRQQCASAWFQSWLCSLPAEPRDLAGLTVGKTVLQRVVSTYEATISRSKAPIRPTYGRRWLRNWPWRPAATDPSNKNQACMYKGVDWGAEEDEAWLVKDSCAQREGQVPPTWLPSSTYLLATFERVLRKPALLNNTTSTKFKDGCSTAQLWWAGQLTVQSLASFGRCTLLSAQRLKHTPSPPNQPLSSLSGVIGASSASSEEEALSMHIRRGDSCMRWAKKRGDSTLSGGRPCFPTEMYLEAARQMRQQYGFTKLHLATDSSAASVEVERALRAEGWTVVSLLFDRGGVGGSDVVNVGKEVDQGTVYIEDRLKAADPSLNKELVISSLAAELELLSAGAALVGTSSSWVSRLAFLAMIGRRGTTPPFVFLDAPFGCLEIKASPKPNNSARAAMKRRQRHPSAVHPNARAPNSQ